jgi:hypothetical protein
VYVDAESTRNIVMPKQSFARLARKLEMEGKKDSAVRVCDYVQQIFPDNKVHFDYYMIQFVDVYYRSNAFDKGNKLANRLIDIYSQNVNYYLSLSPSLRGFYEDELNQSFAFFNTMKQMADENNQKEVSARVEKILNEHLGSLK